MDYNERFEQMTEDLDADMPQTPEEIMAMLATLNAALLIEKQEMLRLTRGMFAVLFVATVIPLTIFLWGWAIRSVL